TGVLSPTTNTYPSTDVPKVIADNTTITSNSPTISGAGAVTKAVVTIGNITHTYDGDLVLTLIAPNNATVLLANRRGTGGDNFINTVFDDAAATPIGSGTAPFTGSFKPEGPLSALNGVSANGVWMLQVADQANIDTGFLNSWSLTLTTLASPTCQNCTPAYA